MKQTTREIKHSNVEYLDSNAKPRAKTNQMQALTKAITKKVSTNFDAEAKKKEKQQKRGRPQGTTNQIRDKKTVAAQKAAQKDLNNENLKKMAADRVAQMKERILKNQAERNMQEA